MDKYVTLVSVCYSVCRLYTETVVHVFFVKFTKIRSFNLFARGPHPRFQVNDQVKDEPPGVDDDLESYHLLHPRHLSPIS